MVAQQEELVKTLPAPLWCSIGAAWLGSLQTGYHIACLNLALDHAVAPGGGALGVTPWLAVMSAAFGAAIAHAAARWLGPRSALAVSALLCLGGSCASSLVQWGHPLFLTGRLLAGLGAGVNSIVVPQYVADVLPHGLRSGTLSHQHPVIAGVGVLCAVLAGLPYHYGVVSVQVLGRQLLWWQIMVGSAAVPALLQVLCLPACPESPAWLEARDKDKADEACIALWGSHAILYEDPPPLTARLSINTGAQPVDLAERFSRLSSLSLPGQAADKQGFARDSLSEALLADENDGLEAETWFDALQRYEYRRIMLLSLGLPVLCQASGGASILILSSQLIPQLATPKELPVASGCLLLALLHLAGAATSSRLAKCIGSRMTMAVSFAGMAICLFASAVISFYQVLVYQPGPTIPPAGMEATQAPGPTEVLATLWGQGLQRHHHDRGGDNPPQTQECTCTLDIINCVLLLAYSALYGLGTGPTLWQYVHTVLPQHIKSSLSDLAGSLSWLAALVVAVTVIPAIQGPVAIGGLFLAYGLFAMLGLVLVVVVMVNPKDLEPCEVQSLLLLHPRPQLRTLFPLPTPSRSGRGTRNSSSGALSPGQASASGAHAAPPSHSRATTFSSSGQLETSPTVTVTVQTSTASQWSKLS